MSKSSAIKNGQGCEMNITEVRVRIIRKDDSKLKGVASITIDNCFVVHDVKIIDGTEGTFIAMPSKRTPEGEYKDIVHPLNSETRALISKLVLEAYEKAKVSPPEEEEAPE